MVLKQPTAVQGQSLLDEPESYFGAESDSAYTRWYDEHGGFYTRSAWFPSTNVVDDGSTGMAVHWTMDEEQENIFLAVVAKAEGWVGFGFSESGGMEGSDIVYLSASQPTQLWDGYIKNDKKPLVDTCQNWLFIRSVVEDGYILLEAQRLLRTEDTHQDRPLIPDSDPVSLATLVIGAWGDDKDNGSRIGYHGPNSRVRGQLRLYQASMESKGPTFAERMAQISDGSFEHRAKDHAVLTRETEYKSFCIDQSELEAQGVNITAEKLYLVGFEHIIDPRAKAHVHHFTAVASSAVQSEDGDCDNGLNGDLIYGWAPGQAAYALPDDVGTPFGAWEDITGLRMIIHYDNPQGVSGILDSSGVRYYYSYKPMKYEMGTLNYGDPLVRMRGDSLVSNNSVSFVSHSFECPSSCSDKALAGSETGVTVFRQFVHMHQKGTAAQLLIKNRQKETVHTSSVDYFRFEQQGRQMIQQESFQVQSGSSFHLNCEYSSGPNDGKDLLWGEASSDEMCMAAIMYYPRRTMQVGFGNQTRNMPWICPYGVPIPGCQSKHESTEHTTEEELGRSFGRDFSAAATVKIDLDACPAVIEVPKEVGSSSSAKTLVTSLSSLFFVSFMF